MQGRLDWKGQSQLQQPEALTARNCGEARGPRFRGQHPHSRAESHFALVRFLEPLAKPDQAALLQGSQVAQVPLDVVCVQFVWNGSHTQSFTTRMLGRRDSRALLREAATLKPLATPQVNLLNLLHSRLPAGHLYLWNLNTTHDRTTALPDIQGLLIQSHI